jgi:hypothetical protein
VAVLARIRFARPEDWDRVVLIPGEHLETVYELPAEGQRFWRGRPHRVHRVEAGEPATIVLVPDVEAVDAISRRLPQGYQLEVIREPETGDWWATLHVGGLRLHRHDDPDDPEAAVEGVLRRAGL